MMHNDKLGKHGNLNDLGIQKFMQNHELVDALTILTDAIGDVSKLLEHPYSLHYNPH